MLVAHSLKHGHLVLADEDESLDIQDIFKHACTNDQILAQLLLYEAAVEQ